MDLLYILGLSSIKKAKYITVISDKTKNEILELIPSTESKKLLLFQIY